MTYAKRVLAAMTRQERNAFTLAMQYKQQRLGQHIWDKAAARVEAEGAGTERASEPVAGVGRTSASGSLSPDEVAA